MTKIIFCLPICTPAVRGRFFFFLLSLHSNQGSVESSLHLIPFGAGTWGALGVVTSGEEGSRKRFLPACPSSHAPCLDSGGSTGHLAGTRVGFQEALGIESEGVRGTIQVRVPENRHEISGLWEGVAEQTEMVLGRNGVQGWAGRTTFVWHAQHFPLDGVGHCVMLETL